MIGSVMEFYRNLTMHFGKKTLPEGADHDAWLENFKEDVGGFSERVYILAAQKLRTDTKIGPKFPQNGEILTACKEVQATLAAESVKPVRKVYADNWTKEAAERADRLLAESPILTNMAIAEGWLLGLHDFTRSAGRTPKPNELGKIIEAVHERRDRVAKMRAEVEADIQAGKTPSGVTLSLIKLSGTMDERERGIRERYEKSRAA